jgi:exopolysaccharide biosynthesis WecB/TagA/CpsF family protein
MKNKIPLLNVAVDNITMDDLLGGFHEGALLTLHVDMIAKLQKDEEFYDLIQRFDVITCDSQILFFAAKAMGYPLQERISGSDFFPKFYMRHRDNPDMTVFICGGAPGVADEAMRRINAKVGRKIVVATDSPPLDFDAHPEVLDRMVEKINASGARALVVGLAAGRQEKFLIRFRERMPHVKLLLPLGGTIDYEAGAVPRPPSWVTDAGLEWLVRLVREPRRRWRRYLVHQPPVLYWLAQQAVGLYSNPFADRDVSQPRALGETTLDHTEDAS